MDAVLPGLWSLSPLAAMVGMIVLFYLGLGSGRIITRSSHEREVKLLVDSFTREMELHRERADDWKDASMKLEEVNQEVRYQNRELIEAVKTSSAFFSSVSLDSDQGERGYRDVRT